MEWDTDIPLPSRNRAKGSRADLLDLFRRMPFGASKFLEIDNKTVVQIRQSLRENMQNPVYITAHKCKENGRYGYRIWKIEEHDRPYLRGARPQPFSTRQQRAVRPGQH